MTLKVSAYCRVSTDEEIQLSSYRNQIQIYMDKIRANPDWVLGDIYADPAISGTTENRPEFQRMLEDAQRKKFDLLLVKSISRFARNTLISIQTVRELKSLGIGVIFEKENIDTTKPYSEMTLTILSAFAQEESRNTSERVKKGIQMRIARGEISWTPLYGYIRKDGEEYIIVEYEAKVIRSIFEDYVKGMKTSEITARLNKEGVPSPGGCRWLDAAVAFVLQNERYSGCVLTAKHYTEDHITHKQRKNNGVFPQCLIKNHHRPIIDEDLFHKAQIIRVLRRDSTYPYGSMLECPNCGKRIGRTGNGWGCECNTFYIPTSRLNTAVLKAYEQLEAKDEKGKEIKAAYPVMERVEYWWLEELADYISFAKDARSLTVHWKCGVNTEISTGYLRMQGDLALIRTVRKRNETAPVKKRRIPKIAAKK